MHQMLVTLCYEPQNMHKPRGSTKKERQEKVRFSEYVEKIPPTTSTTAESTWLTREDHAVTRQQARQVEKDSREFGAGELLSDSFTSSPGHLQRSLNRWSRLSRRGLELRSNRAHGLRRDRERRHSIRSVLHSQKVQRNSGDVDPNQLSQIYEILTRKAIDFASKMGLADANEAQRCRSARWNKSSTKKFSRIPRNTSSQVVVSEQVDDEQVDDLHQGENEGRRSRNESSIDPKAEVLQQVKDSITRKVKQVDDEKARDLNQREHTERQSGETEIIVDPKAEVLQLVKDSIIKKVKEASSSEGEESPDSNKEDGSHKLNARALQPLPVIYERDNEETEQSEEDVEDTPSKSRSKDGCPIAA